MNNQSTRRNFLKKITLGTAALYTPSILTYPAGKINTDKLTGNANSAIQIALIGKGGMGTSDTRTALSVDGVKLVGVCDLYDKRLEDAKKQWGSDLLITKEYKDILDSKDVDAVIIATPDHWHQQIAIEAMKAGKHIYCEKPVIHKLEEGRALINAWEKSSIKFMIGSQGMSSIGNKIAKILIQNGAIGKVNFVDGQFTGAPRRLTSYNPPADASEETIWWDRFLGNAPKIPFTPQRFFAWRNWFDYGTTIAGDLFVHVISSLHYIMDSDGPTKIYTTGGTHHYTDGSRDTPDIMLGYLDYPDKDNRGAFTLSLGANYVDGVSKKWGSTNFKITGSRGTLQVGWNQVTLKTAYDIDEKDILIQDQAGEHLGEINKVSTKEYTFHAVEGYKGGHYHHFLNFFNGIRENKPIAADVNFGVRSSSAALLCNESFLRDKVIKWDNKKLTIKE